MVGNEHAMLRSVRSSLVRKGIQALVVRSGRGALDTLLERHIDLVVIDGGMADMDGLELVRSLLCMYPRIPVVAFADSAPSDSYQSMVGLIGSERVLSKPFDGSEVADTVMHALDMPPVDS